MNVWPKTPKDIVLQKDVLYFKVRSNTDLNIHSQMVKILIG